MSSFKEQPQVHTTKLLIGNYLDNIFGVMCNYFTDLLILAHNTIYTK